MKRTQISRAPSKRKREFDAEYAAVLPGVLARGCEFIRHLCPEPGVLIIDDQPLPLPLKCSGPLRGHHAKGRRARDANEHVICLCDAHHLYVHAHPRWAREVGLMLSRTA